MEQTNKEQLPLNHVRQKLRKFEEYVKQSLETNCQKVHSTPYVQFQSKYSFRNNTELLKF